MRNIRVLKAHREAVLTSIQNNAWLLDKAPQEFAERVASDILSAADSLKYVIVTSDYICFGPYASRATANKAIAKGLCANREGTKALVLPIMPAPTASDMKAAGKNHVVLHPQGEQLALFEMEEETNE